MNQATTNRNQSVRFRRWFVTLGLIVGFLILYALSLGPVLRLCGFTQGGDWKTLPSVVRVTYGPLVNIPEPFAGVLDHYTQWWIKK
jgi:hypothetical protein